METPPLNVVLLSDREDYIEQISALLEPSPLELTVLRDARPLLESTEFDDSTAFIIDMNQPEAGETIIELRDRLTAEVLPVLAIHRPNPFAKGDMGLPRGYVAWYLPPYEHRMDLLYMLCRLASIKHPDREDLLRAYWQRTKVEHIEKQKAEQEEKKEIAEAKREKARAQEKARRRGCCVILFVIVMGIFAFKNLFDWISVHGFR